MDYDQFVESLYTAGWDCPHDARYTGIFEVWESFPRRNQLAFDGKEWILKWMDSDYIEICGPFQQHCVISGGNFESSLSALCAAYSAGSSGRKEGT